MEANVPLNLKLLPNEYSVFQLDSLQQLMSQQLPANFYNITKTDDEISLVCESSYEIQSLQREDGWRILKIDQQLEFDQVGIIARIANILKQAQISIFVISTFNTDFVMVKQFTLEKTKFELTQAGYVIH